MQLKIQKITLVTSYNYDPRNKNQMNKSQYLQNL